MLVSVGTFNLNNLFSRWNFVGAVEEMAEEDGPVGAVTVRYEFTDPDTYWVRTFRGRLVKAKAVVDTQRIASRINAIDLDVLAVQEVENIGTLRQFNAFYLGGRYPYRVLIEGNDPRFIDVGVLSKLPLGAVTSHQTAVHPAKPEETVFGRDLLEVEVLDGSRHSKLFTLYVNHLKSKFVPFDADPAVAGPENDARRQRQAETVARIVAQRQRPNGRYLIVGDMNDTPDSPSLAPLLEIEGRRLVDGLAAPSETRFAPVDRGGPGPASSRWTHRFKPAGSPAHYELLDQIWLSNAMSARLTGSWIDRRVRLTGDGSDHDPAWVTLEV